MTRTLSSAGISPAGRGIGDVLAEVDEAARTGTAFMPPISPTGLTPLDDHLGGGLRGGELTLLGGPQGLGKTVMAMQIARNVVAAGGRATYVTYEHDVEQVLERLLAMEAGVRTEAEAPTLDEVRSALTSDVPASIADRLGPTGGPAVDALRSYADRLRVVRASGARTGVAELRSVVTATGQNGPQLLVVDYLQKVCAAHVAGGEDERVTYVVEALKDLALDTGCAVLAVVAAGSIGLATGRVRLHHLRGSTALAYEADVALLLNDKFDIVARHHLMYGTNGVERYHDWVVCSIEKNRNGVAGIDLEFEKDFPHGRFLPQGRVVAETLADARLGHE